MIQFTVRAGPMRPPLTARTISRYAPSGGLVAVYGLVHGCQAVSALRHSSVAPARSALNSTVTTCSFVRSRGMRWNSTCDVIVSMVQSNEAGLGSRTPALFTVRTSKWWAPSDSP